MPPLCRVLWLLRERVDLWLFDKENRDCNLEVRPKGKAAYSEREPADYDPKTLHPARNFKQQILREIQAGKSIAQTAREHAPHPNLIARIFGSVATSLISRWC
jgi:hypothetical protein